MQPESAQNQIQDASINARIGSRWSRIMSREPKSVLNQFQAAQNCSKMVSGSQNLFRINSDNLETILESIPGSQNQIRVRSGLSGSNPSKKESILTGKNGSIPISSSWSPRVSSDSISGSQSLCILSSGDLENKTDLLVAIGVYSRIAPSEP